MQDPSTATVLVPGVTAKAAGLHAVANLKTIRPEPAAEPATGSPKTPPPPPPVLTVTANAVPFGVVEAVADFRIEYDLAEDNFHITNEDYASYFMVKEK